MRHILSLAFICLVGLAGCNKNQESDKTPIARVGDLYLYLEDIESLPRNMSAKDSIATMKKIVEDWVRQNLVTLKAEENLTDEQKNVEKQLNEYRNSLITYAYQKELIDQHLDTVVSIQEIEKYYETHQKDFLLNNNIVRVIYVKLSKDAPKIDQVKRWIKSTNIKDLEQLVTYCKQFAVNYYLNEETWLYFDDLLKEIPIETYNQELFLKTNRIVDFRDEENIYFLNIKEFKTKESLSPLSFEIDNIKNILLNKRKMQLIENLENDIFNEGFDQNKAEIYINDQPEK